MKITSSAFKHNGRIPALYTCDGKNINPSLEFHDVPQQAKSLVLIMDDPDVPPSVRADRMWVHWVIYDMPSTTTTLKENSTPPGIIGKNTRGNLAYGGPCPPDREHRYFFKLYALDTKLNLMPGATKEDIEEAMAGHILAEAELIGLYERH